MILTHLLVGVISKGFALAPQGFASLTSSNNRVPIFPRCVCARRVIPLGYFRPVRLLPHSRRRAGGMNGAQVLIQPRLPRV